VITAPTLGKVAIVAGALALAAGLAPHRGTSGSAPPTGSVATVAGTKLDATSDAEARQLRTTTRRMGADLSAGARCAGARFVACVAPVLRRAGIGGRMTAMLVRGVVPTVPFGRCRGYLVGLQAANDGASDAARWLLPLLYTGRRERHQREIVTQVALAGRMLRHAARAAPADVCSPGGGGPRS
jgi:hypothetical protein